MLPRTESVEKVSPVDKRYEPVPQVNPTPAPYGQTGPAVPPTSLPKLSNAEGKSLNHTLNIFIKQCRVHTRSVTQSQCIFYFISIFIGFVCQISAIVFSNIINCFYFSKYK